MSRVIEYGRVKYGPLPPAEYGNQSAIPLSVVRELLQDYEEARPFIPHTTSEERVIFLHGPVLDEFAPTRPYGWYVAFEYVGKHRRTS